MLVELFALRWALRQFLWTMRFWRLLSPLGLSFCCQNNPLFFGVYFALKVDRAIDAGFYTVKVEVDNGVVHTPELTLEIKKDGASNLQIPMSIALMLNGPSEIRLNIYGKDSMELVAELGKFSIVNAEK